MMMKLSTQTGKNRSLLLTKITTITLLTSSLIGCGGGGEGGGSSSAPATQVQSKTMDELVVPDGFDYHPVDQYNLNIDVSAQSTARSFVSVYSRYSERLDGTFKPDYASKLIAGPLVDGLFDASFSAPLSEQSLLIEIWFYDGQSPLQKVARTDETSIIW